MNKEKLELIGGFIERKKDFFVDNFLPLELREEFREKSYISGGAIFSLYHDETPKDYDFFLRDKEIIDKLYTYFKKTVPMKYIKGVKQGNYKGLNLIMTDNAITIGKYQIITYFHGSPQEVIDEFDFKHNQFYCVDGKIYTVSGWEYLEEKKLYYNKKRARDICGTIIRVKKFVQRGFLITNKEMAGMLLNLHEKGFTEREIDILRSQDERNDFGS